MKLSCKNCGGKDGFVSTAHITEEWLCDEDGHFVEVMPTDNEVTHEPDEYDLWTCHGCGDDVKPEKT